MSWKFWQRGGSDSELRGATEKRGVVPPPSAKDTQVTVLSDSEATNLDLYPFSKDRPEGVKASPLSISAFGCAIRIKSDSMASLPIKVFAREGDVRGERKVDGPLEFALNKISHGFEHSFKLKQKVFREIETFGNSVALIVRNDRTAIELKHMPWQHVDPQIVNGKLFFVYSEPHQKVQTYAEHEVLHWKNGPEDPETRLGISPLVLYSSEFQEIIDTHKMSQTHASRGGRLSGVLETEQGLDESKAKRLAKRFLSFLNSTNQGGVAVIDAGTTYKEIASNLRESQHVEIRQFQISVVSRITGVPPHLLHSLERATFNNIFELSTSFVRYQLIPMGNLFIAEIEAKLLTRSQLKRCEIVLDYGFLVEASPKEKAEALRALVLSGLKTPDEARAELGLTPKGGPSDLQYMQLAMASLMDISAAAKARTSTDVPTPDPLTGKDIATDPNPNTAEDE